MRKIFLLLMVFFSINANAQQTSPQVIATSGNISQQGNATISYTIGETVIQTGTDGTTILTQGYQQPHYNITLLPQYQNTEPNINIFPNPTTDQLQIKFNNDQELKATIRLMDALGKQINADEYTALPNTAIQYPMQHYASGKYFLTIEVSSNHSIKTFEIIKNK